MMANTLVVEPFARGFSGLRAQYASLIVALMLLVGLLLLLTCANIAGLFLVRAGRRAREVTIRAALGATAGRIARRCLAESLLLALAGGVAGCLAGWWVKTTLAVQVMGTSRQFAAGAALDWRILGFAAGITLTTAAVFGLAPTVHAFRLGRRVPSALNQRSGDGMSGLRGLRPIVVVQLALSVVVVFSATLLGRTLINLSRLDPGFRPGARDRRLLQPRGRRILEHRGAGSSRTAIGRGHVRAGRRVVCDRHVRAAVELLVFELGASQCRRRSRYP